MMDWIKLLMGGKAGLIRSLDKLEPILAQQGQEIKDKIATKSPLETSKYLVDKLQLGLCKVLKVNPKDVDPEFPNVVY